MDICGICGNNTADEDNALCNRCGEDYWVQREDFNNPELKGYVKSAASNLGKTVEQLREMVCGEKDR